MLVCGECHKPRPGLAVIADVMSQGDSLKYIFIFLLFFNHLAFGDDNCSLTDEYVEARKEAKEVVTIPYKKCKSAMREAYYWKAVAYCVSEEKGRNIGGGCSHLVNNGSYPTEYYDIRHCEILRWKDGDIKRYFEHLIEERNIKKCKA